MKINFRRYFFITTQLFLIVLLAMVFKSNVNATITLSQNSDGDYCINSAEDYYQFIEDVRTDERFEGKRIILTQDITVVGEEKPGTYSFRGTVDGKGHEIDFTANNCDETVVVFPFNMRNATICDLRINVHEKLYASKSDNNEFAHCVLSSAFRDSSLKRVQIYGDITLVYDKAGQSVSLSAIPNGRNSVIEDVSVDLNYDYDKTNSLSNDELIESLKNSWNISFNALGSMSTSGVTGMSIKNFYSSSSYSANITELAGIIKENMDPTQFSGLIVKAICAETNSATAENVMFDKEKYPEVTDVVTEKLKYNVEGFTLQNNDTFGKSTIEMKTQSTFAGFDFDNNWGISEFINDGYPYIKVLINPDLIALVDQIIALPEPDKLTIEDKKTIETIRKALENISDKDKARIAFDSLNNVITKAEDAINDLEKKDQQEKKENPAQNKIKKGTTFTVGANKYQVTGDKTATFIGAKNKKVKKITVPASVTYKKQTFKVTAIGPKACKGYKKLATFTVGKNVTAIGAQAFANTPKLKKIKVQSMVLKKVGAKACKGMHKKGVIKVPKKMLKKYKKLFKGKGQKKTVKIK